MADSNYNMIKPVESLQNIGGLTPVKQRKERRRKQDQQAKNHSDQKQETGKTAESDSGTRTPNTTPESSIDYCA